jgi:transposase-like protein
MNRPECGSEAIVKNGKIHLQDQTPLQKYLCKACGKQFNERTGTPMARLRTSAQVVSLAFSLKCAHRRDGRSGDRALFW